MVRRLDVNAQTAGIGGSAGETITVSDGTSSCTFSGLLPAAATSSSNGAPTGACQFNGGIPLTLTLAGDDHTTAPGNLTATIPARSVELAEDGSVAAQGLQLRYPGDGFAVTNTIPPGAAVSLTGAGRDGILGLPAQTNRIADVYC